MKTTISLIAALPLIARGSAFVIRVAGMPEHKHDLRSIIEAVVSGELFLSR